MQVPMDKRGQVAESLLTGVKAFDTLTPLGRGACQLIIGPDNSGKSTLASDIILGQRDSGVKCVYAVVNRTEQELQALVDELKAGGATGNTAVVSAPATSTLGEKYAAICAACALGGRRRQDNIHITYVSKMAMLCVCSYFLCTDSSPYYQQTKLTAGFR